MKILFAQQASILALSFVSACTIADQQLLINGGGSRIDKAKIQQFAADQNEILVSVSRMAGIGNGPPVTDAQWRSFVTAGITYVDLQCTDYLSALDRFYRYRNTTKRQFELTGAATLGILGLVGAAAQAISITGIAFGLASATHDNLTSGLIYELPASAVIQLVRDLQNAYKANMRSDAYTDRATSFAAIQAYINLCLPVSIETQVANAVKVAKPDVKPGAVPIVQIGQILATSYSADDTSKLLETFVLKADKSVDPDKITAIRNAMAEADVKGIEPPSLIWGPFPEERRKVAIKLGLIK